MPSRSLVRPAALAAVATSVLVAGVCPAKEPAVPPVSEIPVAPAPKPKKALPPLAAPAGSPSTTTTTVTTTTVTAPSLVAMTPEEAPGARGVPEAMPATPAAAPAAPTTNGLRVVVVDQLPSKTGHARARELPEHDKSAHHPKHGRHGRPFHPAPGIVVDVSTVQGGATSADLQRAARNVGYWPFRHCYEEGLQRNQQLSGSVRFGLVRQSGVSTTQLVESTVKDESVTLCVLREARALDLPWATADVEAAADLKISLATGDEPVPTPHAVPHADELRDALRESLPAVQQCYAAGVAKHPDDGGRMELYFHERSDGALADVSEDEPRFGDVDVTRCVMGVYRTAKLPKLHHMGSFVYPLHFEASPSAGK